MESYEIIWRELGVHGNMGCIEINWDAAVSRGPSLVPPLGPLDNASHGLSFGAQGTPAAKLRNTASAALKANQALRSCKSEILLGL
jgi:hypothetical protein